MQLLGSDPRRQFSLAEICRTLGITRATGHAIMATLVAHDWAMRDAQTAGYSRGSGFSSLAEPDTSMLRAELKSLASATGTQVMLTQPQGKTLVVIDVAGQNPSAAFSIERGTRTPMMIPWGRDFVAWASPETQDAWLRAIGEPPTLLRSRIQAVLNEIRQRRYAVERLSRASVRVWAAIQAVTADGEIDSVMSRLAHTLTEETIIDALDDELSPGVTLNISTVNAPIFDANGVVTLTVSAAPFTRLEGPAVRALGEQMRAGAEQIQDHLALAGGPPRLKDSH